jgi:DNA-binding transcriptional LysR family regulator
VATSAPVLLKRLLARARLRHLQVLVQVAELGSLQRAAQVVGLTQPAVTHIVNDLEGLLGAALFQRHARGARPTALALDLLPAARRMLDALGQGTEAVAARLDGGGGVVRVLGSAAALSGLLHELLPGFAQAHPRIQVHATLAEADVLGSVLPIADVDLVACRAPPVLPEGWQFSPLRADRLVVVCGPTHRLARRRRIRLAELADETWLVSPVESLARRALEALAEAEGWALKRAPIVTRALPLSWATLAQGDCVTLVPLGVVQQLVQAGQLLLLPVDRVDQLWPITSLGLLHKGDATRPAAQTLRDHCLQRCA